MRLPTGVLTALIATCMTAASLAVANASHAKAPDDIYIVWRYVQNITAGNGWVYNLGEPVNACTSAVQLLVLTGLALLGCEQATAFVVASGCAIAIASVLLFLHTRNAQGGWLLPILLGVTAIVLPLHGNTCGLETQLQMAVIVAIWIAWQRRRATWFGALAALAILVRPDTLLFAAGCLVMRPANQQRWSRRELLRGSLAASAVLLPWAAFSLQQFGHVLPATLAAKVAQGQSGWWPTNQFLRSLQVSLRDFDTWQLLGSYKPFLILLAVGLAACWRSATWRPFFAYALAQAIGYALLRVPFYHWYALPTHMAVALSPFAIAEAITGRGKTSAFGARICVALLLTSMLSIHHRERQPLPYQDAGTWIAANSNPTATVACAEIGVLGVAVWPRSIIDLAGLVTPRALPSLRRADFTWPLQEPTPDYFVLHDPEWPRLEGNLVDDPRFQAHYERVPHTFRAAVAVWQRKQR